MNDKRSKSPALLVRARVVAAKAADDAVTTLMTAYMADKELPTQWVTWSIRQRPDGSEYLAGHVEAATPDSDVRSIVEAYAIRYAGPEGALREQPHGSDPDLREYEATGLVIDGAPAEVWGILGYSAGESGE